VLTVKGTFWVGNPQFPGGNPCVPTVIVNSYCQVHLAGEEAEARMGLR
jgi:hypothetical protein